MSLLFSTPIFFFFFFFNDTATTEIYTLSLHDALPILDVFEDALQALGGRERVDRAEARVRDDHDLAGLDVALPPRLHQVERARLRGEDPGVAEPADRERAEAVRVADRVHRVGREDQERVGALHLAERVEIGRAHV